MDPLPQYWRTARAGMVTAWGWSTQSADEALSVANERLANSLKAIGAGLRRDRRGSYGWTPPREETLQELHDANGSLIAVVSRNRYGADVVGTDRLLIADVDVPPDRPVTHSVRRLFGRKKDRPKDDGPKARALQLIEDFASAHPNFGVRVYETFGGFRVIVTGSGLEPGSPDATGLFEQLDTDQIYVHLCRKYNTCRARLTPKPWRCGVRAPRTVWPLSSDDERRELSDWLASYHAASAGHATCRLVDNFGPAPHPDELQIIELHDRATRIGVSGLPLA